MISEIIIINKMDEKIKEYQQKYGSTRTWIAKELGYLSRQSLDGAISSKNPTAETLGRVSNFLNCKIDDLIEVKVENKAYEEIDIIKILNKYEEEKDRNFKKEK